MGQSLFAALLLLPACGAKTTSLRIVDHRADGRDVWYHETFDECWFAADAEGNIDLVLRRERPVPDDPSQSILQVVHLRSFWKPIPGTTVAQDQQINASVRYLMLSGRVGASFEGAGSVFFRAKRDRERLEGEIELAQLLPRTRLNGGRMLFDRAEVSGEFVARRDPRRVVRMINELDGLFEFDRAGTQTSAAAP